MASLDYRLLGDAPAPAAIQDTKAAIRFLRDNAAFSSAPPCMTWARACEQAR